MAKKKKDERETYEGTKLYSDVTPKEIKSDKKQLLKEMALAGSQGMRQLDRATKKSYKDRHDSGLGNIMEGTEAVERAIDKQRNKMMGGLETARDMQGRSHSQEMDRIAARNVSYLDKMRHAARLAQNSSRERIAAMKLAADARAGGGGGGGGSTGGFPAPIPSGGDDETAAALTRLEEIYWTSASKLAEQGINPAAIEGFSMPALANNPELALQLDDKFAIGVENGADPNEMQSIVFNDARNSGVSFMDSLAIAHTLGQNYGGSTSAGDAMRTAGGPLSAMRETVPGLNGLMQLAGFGQLNRLQAPTRTQKDPKADPRSSTPAPAAPKLNLGSAFKKAAENYQSKTGPR